MPLGKQIGSYESKSTSIKVVSVSDEDVVEVTYEGTTTGDLAGPWVGTATYCGSDEEGEVHFAGIGWPEPSGERVKFEGSGLYKRSGANRWQTRVALRASTGEQLVSEGQVDHTSRSWVGDLFTLE